MQSILKFFRLRHVRVLVVVVVAVGLSAGMIWYLTYSLNGTNPIGWDAPYYLYKDRLLMENGIWSLVQAIGGYRIGYTIFTVMLYQVLDIPLVTLERWLPFIMILALASMFGWIVWQLTRRLPATVVTAVSTLFSFGFNDIALRNNSDNLFAYVFFVLYLILLIWRYRSIHTAPVWYLGLIGLCLLIIGLTHLETMVLAALTTLIFSIWDGLQQFRGQFRAFWKAYWRLAIVWVAVCVVVGALWGQLLLSFSDSFVNYTSATSKIVNYTLPISLTGTFFQPNQFGVYVAMPLILLGLLAALRQHKANPRFLVIFSWLLALIIIFLTFYFLKFEYNFFLRILSLLPLSILLGFAVAMLEERLTTPIVFLAVAGLLSINLLYLVKYFHDSRPFVDAALFEQLPAASQYVVREHNAAQPVYFSVATPIRQGGEFAYFGMWSNWIRSYLPNQFVNRSGIHFGDPRDLFVCRPTTPPGSRDTEYAAVSEATINAICQSPGTTINETIIVEALNKPMYDEYRAKPKVKELAPGVLLVKR